MSGLSLVVVVDWMVVLVVVGLKGLALVVVVVVESVASDLERVTSLRHRYSVENEGIMPGGSRLTQQSARHQHESKAPRILVSL